MKTYQATSVRARIVTGTVSLAIAALLLEVVAGGFLHPDVDAVAMRQQMLAFQAGEAARMRALVNGELKCVDAGAQPRS